MFNCRISFQEYKSCFLKHPKHRDYSCLIFLVPRTDTGIVLSYSSDLSFWKCTLISVVESPLQRQWKAIGRLVSQCSLWSLWNDSERCDHRQFHIECYLVLLEDTLWCRNLLPTYSIGSLSLIARLKLKVSRLTFDAVCHEKLLSRLEMYCFVLSSPNGSERFCADVWTQLLASACCPERSAPIRASRYPFVSGRC